MVFLALYFPILAAGWTFLAVLVVCGLLFVVIAWHSVDCGRRTGVFIVGVLVGHDFRFEQS